MATPQPASAPAILLTDFGLAKNIETGSRLTRTGETLGTPAYMSPELARGEVGQLTPASDVWALGCVLHELLANRRAFDGASPAAVIGAVLTTTPALPPGAPPPCATVLRVSMARQACDRYPDAAALRDDCDRLLAGSPPVARPPRSRGPLWLAVAALLLALAAGAAWWFSRDGASREAAVERDSASRLADQAWRVRQDRPREAIAMLERACAQSRRRHDWQIRLGLLHWSVGEVEPAVAIWAAIPGESPLRTRAWWLTGLALASECIIQKSDELAERAYVAYAKASEGSGPEARWGLAGLTARRDLAGARTLLGTPTEWTAALLLGLTESGVLAREHGWRLDIAIAAYDLALQEGLAFPWALVNRGHLKQQRGDSAGAKADLDRAIRLDPTDAKAFYARAVARHSLGDVDGELADLRRACALAPKQAAANAALARVLRERGDEEGARAAFQRAVTAEVEELPGLQARASVREECGDLRGALADLTELLRALPNVPRFWCQRGRVHGALGNWDAAAADVTRAIEIGPATAVMYADRAAARMRAGHPNRALADAARAVEMDPESANAYFNRGRIRMELGDAKGALRDFGEVVRLDPADPRGWNNRGAMRDRMDDLDGALADFTETIRVDPDDAEGYFNRALVRKRMGDRRGAEADYGEAIARDPTHHRAHQNRGRLRMNRGDAGGADADFLRTTELAPHLADGWAYRGAVLIEAGRVAEGMQHLRRAETIDGDNRLVLIGIAMMDMRGKRWAAAAKRLRRLIALAPEHPQVGFVRAQLARCEQALRQGR